MISPSRLIKWLSGAELQQFKKYSNKDKKVNEEETPQYFNQYEAEVEVQNTNFHGILDFCKRDNGNVVEWIECKARSNWDISKEMLLQCLIYENITNCKNWNLCLMNRQMGYEKIMYDRKWLFENCKNHISWCEKIIEFVLENFNELNYVLAREKIGE